MKKVKYAVILTIRYIELTFKFDDIEDAQHLINMVLFNLEDDDDSKDIKYRIVPELEEVDDNE